MYIKVNDDNKDKVADLLDSNGVSYNYVGPPLEEIVKTSLKERLNQENSILSGSRYEMFYNIFIKNNCENFVKELAEDIVGNVNSAVDWPFLRDWIEDYTEAVFERVLKSSNIIDTDHDD